MPSPVQSLDQAMKLVPYPSELPLALPSAHVTIARWFGSIVDRGILEPRHCDVFGHDLIYLFYGGVFYRKGNQPTRNVLELPIAFVFNPTVLKSIVRYYPFDTGAMAAGRFGPWSTKYSASFKDAFMVPAAGDFSTPSKMVYQMYGGNSQYLEGRIDPSCRTKPVPFPELHDFMSADLSPNVDHRQCIIECQSRDAIGLGDSLLWVGFPNSMTDEFARLYEHTKPTVPEYYDYPAHVIFNPIEVAARLQDRAYDVIKRYVDLPGK